MKELTIVPKIIDKSTLSEKGKLFIPKDRELIIEEDVQSPEDASGIVYRFKIGDGITSYSELSYVSSLYSLFPRVSFCDNSYENCLTLKLDR